MLFSLKCSPVKYIDGILYFHRFTKSDHEALVEIFKKIGQKELTKVGLQELYNFKVENPHVDLEPFLAQSSQYFREYIERGMKKIEEEVKIGTAPSQSGIPAPSSFGTGIARPSVLTDNVNSASGGQPQHLVYLERLKRFDSNITGTTQYMFFIGSELQEA